MGYFVMFVCLAWVSGSVVFSSLVAVYAGSVTIRFTPVTVLQYVRLTLVPMFFVLPGVLPLLFTTGASHEAWVIKLAGGGITLATLKSTTHLAVRSYASLCAMFFLVLTTPVSHLLWLMRKCRMPVLLVDLTGLVYRNIFIILQDSQQVFFAQKSRLAYLGSRASTRHFAQLLGSTFILSIKKANDQYNSLEARCYNNNLVMIDPVFIPSRGFATRLAATGLCLGIVCYLSYYFAWI
jgi:cobalt/nickel transport system permease protein